MSAAVIAEAGVVGSRPVLRIGALTVSKRVWRGCARRTEPLYGCAWNAGLDLWEASCDRLSKRTAQRDARRVLDGLG